MTSSINKAIIVGHVGNKPEIRRIQGNGEELATFNIATNEKWKDRNNGEIKEKTEWHKIVVFNPGLVKIVKSYVEKGSKLYIEGKITTREYQDQSGIKKQVTEIILSTYNSTLLLVDSKNKISKEEEIENKNTISNEIPF